jgi:hypothetical protein
MGISVLLLTGCIKEYPLSEVQTDAVAEYMAGRLLMEDKNYLASLLTYEEIIDFEDNIEEDNIEEDNLVPKPTKAPDAVNDNEDNVPIKDVNYTLSEVIGVPNFDIIYSSYKLVDTYPEDESNLVFSLDPRPGYQLLVLNFTIENITDKNEVIDLSLSTIQYQLDINVGSIYKPQLALLENNLQYINLNLKAGEKIPAVLIFEVAQDIDLSDIKLIISRDSRSEIVEIK